jgi:hypothetical protein
VQENILAQSRQGRPAEVGDVVVGCESSSEFELRGVEWMMRGL